MLDLDKSMKFEMAEDLTLGTKIKVVGVGGGGCNAVARMMQAGLTGHLLLTTVHGEGAAGPFARITENPGKFDVLIADNTMPGLTGSELIQKLRAVNFSGKIMVLSGHLTPELERIYRALGVEEIVRKPYDLSSIRMALERIASGDDPARQE